MLAEFAFQAPSDMAAIPELPWWDPKKGTVFIMATARHQWTTFADAAAYTVDIVTSDDAEKGGTYSILSDAGDVFHIAKTWKEATGKDVKLIPAGDVEELRAYPLAGRKAHPPNEWKEYIGPFYCLHTIGDWNLDEDHLYTSDKVTPTKLRDFFELHNDRYAKF